MEIGAQAQDFDRPSAVAAEAAQPASRLPQGGQRLPLRGVPRRSVPETGPGDAARADRASRGCEFERPVSLPDSRAPTGDPSPATAAPATDRTKFHSSPLEVIPDWLRTPDPTPVHGAWRADAALVLDRQLVNLVSMEARGRLVQAGLVTRLLDGKLWQDAAFVRLSDYAAERLGLTSRTLQEDAHVTRALAALPLLRSAFLDGAISWTHLRLLVAVAEPADEADWIRRALSSTTRTLEALVRERKLQMRAHRETGQGAAAAPSSDIPTPETPNACASTPHADSTAASPDTYASSDPRDVTAQTANSCASTASSDATAGPANACASTASAAAAAGPANACASPFNEPNEPDVPNESSSSTATDDPPIDDPTADEPTTRWATRASRDGRRLWRQARETAERAAGSILTQAQVLELVAAEAMAVRPGAPTGPPFPQRQPEPSPRERAEAAERGFREEYGCAEGFSWVEPPHRDAGAAAELDRLLDNLDSADVHEVDRRLRELRAAMQRIDWQIGTVLRVAVGRRLYRDLGFATMELYVESRLGMSYRKASFLVNLERKSWSTTAELREAYRDGRLTPLKASAVMRVIDEQHGPAWIQRATEVTFRRLTDEVTWALNRKDLDPFGHRCAPPPHDLDVRAEIFSQLSPADLQMRAHAAFDAGAPNSRATVSIEMEVPESVAKLVEEALSTVRRDWEPRWRAFERMVALAVLEWTSVPRHRDPIFARDGWCCSVPGCRSRRNLHVHHIEFRSRGGSHARTNRTTVCAAHHNQGLHGGGGIHAEGEAPHAILWEIGCRPGRAPLLRTLGDRYLDPA